MKFLLCEHLPKGLLLLLLCHLSGWLGHGGCWAGTSFAFPRRWHCRVDAETVGGLGGEKLSTKRSGQAFFLLIFPVGIHSSLVPWFMKLSDAFVLLWSLFLWEIRREEEGYEVLCQIYSDPRRPLFMGFAMRCLSLQTGKNLVVTSIDYYWLKGHFFPGRPELTLNHEKS